MQFIKPKRNLKEETFCIVLELIEFLPCKLNWRFRASSHILAVYNFVVNNMNISLDRLDEAHEV